MTKNEARKFALNKRKTLNTIEISKEKISNIVKSNILEEYKRIGIYYPLSYEINLLELLKIYNEKEFYLPSTKDKLYFIKYETNFPLIDGPFKTKEPIGNPVDINYLDCIIIPCVAISKENKRLGYGKGYYDKTLSQFNGFKIGVCYEELLQLDVDMDEFDVILDFII